MVDEAKVIHKVAGSSSRLIQGNSGTETLATNKRARGQAGPGLAAAGKELNKWLAGRSRQPVAQ